MGGGGGGGGGGGKRGGGPGSPSGKARSFQNLKYLLIVTYCGNSASIRATNEPFLVRFCLCVFLSERGSAGNKRFEERRL